ncbi:MAG TPA: OmcA/MtrC family decaheme c-type cytochrome [Dehalococcoidales bacterium]
MIKPVLVGLSLCLVAAALGILLMLSACQPKANTTLTVPATPSSTVSANATVPATSPSPSATPAAVPPTNFSATITKVDISTDGKITVSYTLKDQNGNPLSRSQLDANRERFSIARIVVDPDTGYTQWLSYVVADVQGTVYKLNGVDTQPALPQVTGVPVSTGDSTGDYKEIAVGQYTYTFKTVLPANYDINATTRVMYQASKDNRVTTTTATFDFVPAGGDVKVTRQVIATDNCNKCHDPLVAHGSRKDTKLCVICHTPQNIDPESGNSVDFKSYIHKIHDAVGLPSVQSGKSFNIGTSDFSDVVWPQDVRNCTTCHSGAPDAYNYKNNPSRAACGACHDQIDWSTGKSTIAGLPDHPGGPQTDDKTCKQCHIPDSGKEFDASIVGAHTIPANSKQLKGVNYTLVAATVQPGQKATVDFNIKDNSGNPIDPSTMTSLALTLAWPTTDYSANLIETVNSIPAATAAPFVRAGALNLLGNGDYRYTFSATVPSTWEAGSAGVSIYGYKNATIKGNYGKDTVVREGNVNPVIYVSVDNTDAVARRTVVNRNKCNSCHLNLGSPAGLAIHGGARRNTQICIQCHIVTLNDEARHPKDQLPPESLHFDYLIHSIHMGDNRVTATNFNGAINTQDIAFPGNPADCLKCHNPGTYTLPLPAGVLPQIVVQGGSVVSITQPITAACAGCHAGDTTNGGFEAHAASMTNSDRGETCADCHGVGKPYDVVKVHSP